MGKCGVQIRLNAIALTGIRAAVRVMCGVWGRPVAPQRRVSLTVGTG